jgi:hypothetical protein
MNGLTFNQDDLMAIECAKNEGGRVWYSAHLSELKAKIKAYYRVSQGEQCCYCRKNTNGEFNMVLDIEHILPQSIFSQFMFEINNLSVSCKRCNMMIKKNDISFIAEGANIVEIPFLSSNYKFIHPNLDQYFDHISYEVSIRNNETMIKYSVVMESEKGSYTYDYFKFHELEVDSFNRAQGIESNVAISDQIDSNLALEIDQLLGRTR